MSEKIILSVEQGKAVDYFNRAGGDTLDYIAKRKSGKSPFIFDYVPFNDMTLEDIAKATYIGYEIEKPKFKIGDKAVINFDSSNEVGTVSGVTECGKGLTVSFRTHMSSTASVNFRHATLTEIIFAELGRELNEVHQGDVIISIHGSVYIVDDEKSEFDDFISKDVAVLKFHNSSVKGFYPASSFIKLP